MYSWLQLNSASDLVAGFPRLIAREYAPLAVANALAGGISDAVKAILIESKYIDKDYRSTYYSFYSKKGQRYNSDCVRLHFFDHQVSFDADELKLKCEDGRLEDHYFGYMVLRPTGISTIGRTVLSPDIRSGASRYIISSEHKVHLLGYKLKVQGFPSMDQHIDISVCAHVACWSILRHYSERYNIYREFLTHDITMMAHDYNPGGLVPSQGLNVAHAERVFQEAGTFPVLIRKRSGATDPEFYRQLIAYVESGFPLFAAMHGRSHAVAVVGCQWTAPGAATPNGLRYAWDEIEQLAVVDDNHLPYLAIPKSGGAQYSAEDIDVLIVPLPEKIFYPADAVDRLARIIFKLGSAITLPNENETTIRYFVTTGSALRRFVRDKESEFDPKLIKVIMTLPFAQFVWVIEFATQAQRAIGQIAARAIVDATASLREEVPLWLLHNTAIAMVFDRSKVGEPTAGFGTLSLANMGHSGFTRMDQNLRPTQAK